MLPMKAVGLGFALILTACTDPSLETMDMGESDYAVAPPPAPMMSRSSADAGPSGGGSGEIDAPANYLAYRYGFDFSLPGTEVQSTAQQHADLCLEAGPRLCQILSHSTREYDADNISANITLRAEPDWLDGFQTQMSESVAKADGKLTSSRVSAEDLTRKILDVDARLSAQTTLRDRLQGLLETHNAELADLLSLERELARVQGEIESATSTLRALRERVNMSIVDISYETRSRAVSSSALSPIGRALKQFVGTLSEGLAAVINFFAFILPWLLFLILPVIWLLVWLRRRSAKRKRSS